MHILMKPEIEAKFLDVSFDDVMAAYRAEYPHLTPRDTVATIPVVKFGDPLPELLKAPDAK